MSQKFALKDPDCIDSWMEPPEDWQFENPLASGKIRGRTLEKPSWPRLNIKSILPNKEEKRVEFIDLPMNKQIKLVANEYNNGRGVSETQRRLGIKGSGTYYDRLDKAKTMGLIKDPERERKFSAPAKQAEAELTPQPRVTADVFGSTAAEKQALAEKLLQEAERLKQAEAIAQAMAELLGDDAVDLLGQLYEKVSA